jgi:hypothetical protein
MLLTATGFVLEFPVTLSILFRDDHALSVAAPDLAES